ncbi:MAG: NAD(P)H-binding protein [Pseudomonadota bacterium]
MKQLAHLILITLISFVGIGCNSLSAQQSDSAKVLVFGGTGKLGSDIVKALEAEGHQVTVFVRSTSDKSRLAGLKVDYVVGDALEFDSVQAAMSGRRFDVVVDALERGPNGAEFYAITAQNLARAASAARVKQIILHGSIGAGDSAHVYPVASNSGIGKVFRAKSVGEKAVMNSNAKYTIIRNGELEPYGTKASGNARLYSDRDVTGRVTRLALARLTAECVLKEHCLDQIFHAVDQSLRHDRR